MKLYEFILLILGIFSLINYIIYSLLGVYKENPNIVLIRIIEFAIILINIALWVYKLLF